MLDLHIVDMVILTWLLISSIWVAWTGAIRFFFGMAVVLLSIYMGLNYAESTGQWLQGFWETPMPSVFGFITVLLGWLFAGFMCLRVLAFFKDQLGLSWLDAISGMALGFGAGVLSIWVVLSGMRIVFDADKQQWWKQSAVVPTVMQYGDEVWNRYQTKDVPSVEDLAP
jgi:uncharacterized membrane protein required for colicin V production